MKRRANDKAELPAKTCAACRRPFTWRKKWAKDWANVRYCSARCRRDRTAKGEPAARRR
ncbi:MAG: DUF2256 domain-containing protein [Alphaproteobacteria bacterium]|nr:DUF2256 domain-containing protein [Alphaproteobacteria bacterium]